MVFMRANKAKVGRAAALAVTPAALAVTPVKTGVHDGSGPRGVSPETSEIFEISEVLGMPLRAGRFLSNTRRVWVVQKAKASEVPRPRRSFY